MTNQDALFYEDWRGAIAHLVGALGGAKAVGGMLRPSMTVKQSEQWVHDCLNINRQSKFDFEDIVALLAEGRRRSIHCAMDQLADETQYKRPDPAPPKTPEQEIASEMEKLAARYKALADDMARLKQPNGRDP